MNRFRPHLDWLDQQHNEMIDVLKSFVAVNTFTANVEGHRRFADVLLPVMSRLGQVQQIELPPRTRINDKAETESIPVGNAYSLRSPQRNGPRVLLGIHTDTVFAPDSPFQSPILKNGDILNGPGACDAKGGIVVLLYALMALERSPFASTINWEILLNPDEEVGSPCSGELWKAAAGRNDLGMLYEPARPDGTIISARKGAGTFTFIVRGRAAHAGREPSLGRNAIHALSTLISKLAASQDDYPGLIINTGYIGGGGPVNIVPDLALARVNVRSESFDQMKAFEKDLQRRVEDAQSDGITVTRHGTFGSPPKPMTPPIEKMLHQLRDCAKDLGHDLKWIQTGGVSDGNKLLAAGLPNVDSLGVRGSNLHTDQEFAHLDSLPERAKLSALYLMRLATKDISAI
jgi:glutamate carboxypeptidase